MLSRISIQNYAIIDALEVDFSSKLNIITGETGAGKSILIGALGLILGQRAESNVLLNREKKCVVEGCFKGENSDAAVLEFLREEELDVLDELVVRREISPNGKSRAFINDTPVNLAQLHRLSSLLVDLHQQFDTMEIGQADFQREVLDALAGNGILVKKYQDTYRSFQVASKELAVLKNKKSEFEKEADYHQFQFDELEEAGFGENEIEDLDAALRVQSNAEGIRTALSKLVFGLSESEDPLLRQLKAMSNALQPYASVQTGIPALIERLQSAQIELQDISSEASDISDHINVDPQELERINERLSTGYRLFKKHGVKTTADLLSIKEQLAEKLQAVLNIDETIVRLETESQKYKDTATAEARKISDTRLKQVKPLEAAVNKMLVQVGMPNARIRVDIRPATLSSSGADEIEFLFDANKSNQFSPIRKVASGGELSRLMLCIKSLVAASMNLPTLIFDEIDTGISGEAAKQVGLIMKELASARQVICITHQPQIAGKADAHFFVYKSGKEGAVTTGVRKLDSDERVLAIARMMSGEKPTAAAMENARELVMN